MGAAVGLALASVVWAQDAGDAASWSALGRSLRREQRPAEAEAALRRALQLSPQAEDENLLGLLLFEQQRPEEAAESFRAAIARNPGDAQVYSNLAVALSELGRSEEAIASCRLGLARSKSVKAQNFLGELLLGSGRIEEAMQIFRESWAMAPAEPETNHQLGSVLMLRSAFAEAVPHLLQALQHRGEDKSLWSLLGYAYELDDKDAQAETLFRAMLNTSFKEAALWRLSRLARVRGEGEAAEKLLREVLELGSKEAPRYRRELGSALFIQGREAEAEAEWLGSLEELRKAGLSLVHFNSNFEFSETRYQEARAAEDAAFRHHVGQGPLLEMLRAVRRRENTSDWLLTWARESAGRFRGARLVSYGVTYFQAWREASSVPIAAAKLRRRTRLTRRVGVEHFF
ncbi:unnamed protein product [Effrenium voratum]|nr:unnamed protein product [Effrenium voratum]